VGKEQRQSLEVVLLELEEESRQEEGSWGQEEGPWRKEEEWQGLEEELLPDRAQLEEEKREELVEFLREWVVGKKELAEGVTGWSLEEGEMAPQEMRPPSQVAVRVEEKEMRPLWS
jgi:hypothetical protein